MGDHSHDHSHGHVHGHGHRYPGTAEALRSPERLALLDVGRVVDLCLEGIACETILDAGVGAGVFAEEFAQRGLHLTGIDINPDMIEAARHFVPSATLVEAQADALPFGDNSFDLVVLGHVLHEVPDPVRALSEAHRVARLRVAVLEWPYRAEDHGPPLEHRLRDTDIIRCAREAGFAHVEALSLAHTALYRLAP